MSVSLSKGGNVSLTKEAPGITKALAGLGWDARSTDGQPFDLDAMCFLLDANGKVRDDQKDFVYFRNLVSGCGSVRHHGDNQTGAGSGDDEKLSIDLAKVPADVQRIVFAVIIYEGTERRQTFGMVSNAYIRICDEATGHEVARYDLNEDASTETALIFGELYRHNGDWKFRAIGQGYREGFRAMVISFGVNPQ